MNCRVQIFVFVLLADRGLALLSLVTVTPSAAPHSAFNVAQLVALRCGTSCNGVR